MIKYTNNKKGHIGIAILMSWMLMIIIVLLMFAIEMYFINLKGAIAQDNVMLSNLAIYKDLDLQALGDTPKVFRINDANTALNTFKEYLSKNMDLDSNLVGKSNSIAVGQVKINSYIIYNINGAAAEIYTYDRGTLSFVKTNIANINVTPIYTPLGTRVLKTTVHSKIDFMIEPILKGVLGNTRQVSANVDTDITN
jgi:hypothetical protein